MTLNWSSGRLSLQFSGAAPGAGAPVGLSRLALGDGQSAVRDHPLVDVFTAGEQRERTSQAFVLSAVGHRLRYVDHDAQDDVLRIRQRDTVTGLEVVSELRVRAGADAVQWRHTVRNGGARAITVTAISSIMIELADRDGVGLLWAESEWLAENRWHEQALVDALPGLGLAAHGQDARGRFVRSSHGSWSSGEYLPVGVLARSGGPSLAWQIETSAGWSWELGQTQASVILSASGPSDLEHQFAERLEPGAEFTSEPAGLAIAAGGRDDAFAALTRYRRTLRELRPVDRGLPVIYNDYMNTLDGQPSSAALLPLIESAAEAGAEYFCIDAGWFTDATDYWSAIGVWEEAPSRFAGGLAELIDTIRTRGMRPGLWLEPEIVGVDSPAASTLPEEAFFQRMGERVVEAHRYHLDLRHPAARAHVDEAIDRLVRDFGIDYIKLDYNINPGVGTDRDAAGAGAGLLGHTRALREWLLDVQARHPELLVENCASGAMRMDYALLSVAHLQSTSDQQDFRLYPVIAAAAPAAVLPEQAANWAYPATSMSDAETAYSLIGGIAGRMMLSGFLHELRPAQQRLVHQAVALQKTWRERLASSDPIWPLGLPGWDADVIALALRAGAADPDAPDTMLAVWSRGDAQRVVLSGLEPEAVECVFPADADDWAPAIDGGDLVIEVPAGHSARIFAVHRNRENRG
ncbi:alpha-galactosidase [Microbacterium natoriense]|uniref:alpha-galactosidase n=1 Tax=Microbacterium natoriense TaxID=284570 RepID=A0AAW8ESQ2_9MICO|nr:glycoside hydrolase family 36 protein [Microbacterium natoriense]MDQ0646528.1 alpha-galactosidase [Microbacterium natoriense]